MSDNRWDTASPKQLEDGSLGSIASAASSNGVNVRCFVSTSGSTAIALQVRAAREAQIRELPDEAPGEDWLVATSQDLPSDDLKELLAIVALQGDGTPAWWLTVSPDRPRPAQPVVWPRSLPKRGEGPDNLRRRADWFEERSGPRTKEAGRSEPTKRPR